MTGGEGDFRGEGGGRGDFGGRPWSRERDAFAFRSTSET